MKRIIIGFTLGVMTATATAQTCNPNTPITRPDSRYQILTNGTEVKDTVTGLIWQRCSLGQEWDGSTCTGEAIRPSWQDALKLVNSLDNDYHLPNIKELLSLVETACQRPTINSTVFPNSPTGIYWSASPTADDPGQVWSVYFGQGYAFDDGKDNYSHARGVRVAIDE